MIEYAQSQFWAATDDDPPDGFAYIWRWFSQLSDKRTISIGMSGAVLNPVSHSEIEAWARLFKIELALWEVSLLNALDQQFRLIYSEKQNDKCGGTTVQDVARDAEDLKIAIAAKAERERNLA